MLIVLGGLPGVGKTPIARAFSKAASAVHVRIDSIEQAICQSGVTVVSLDDAGYRAAYAVAEDNLLLGHIVVADSVNPLPITRAAWLDVARRAGTRVIEVEIRCSDQAEHRRRVEQRLTDGEQTGPVWSEVLGRDYRAWPTATLVIDTANTTIDEAVTNLRVTIGSLGP
ncbi:MAG: AAA family ATPase [Luteitalea sp.]|nr:AAA family ATPase [Luteitalea sp.]